MWSVGAGGSQLYHNYIIMQMRYGIACRRGGDVEEEEVEDTVDCVLNGQSR